MTTRAKRKRDDGIDVVLERIAAGVVRVVLTQRSSSLPTHKGEVCLPGGKRDPGDKDDEATALREANEELGLEPARAQVVGRLRPFLSKHYLSVTPVLARVPPERDQHAPRPNTAEVAAVFDVPLEVFLGTQGHTSHDIEWHGHHYRIHYFDHQAPEGRFNIWGLTASILIQVAKHALGREPAFKEHAPRGSEYTRFWYDGQQLRVHRMDSPATSGQAAQQDAGGGQQGADDVHTQPAGVASMGEDLDHAPTAAAGGAGAAPPHAGGSSSSQRLVAAVAVGSHGCQEPWGEGDARGAVQQGAQSPPEVVVAPRDSML